MFWLCITRRINMRCNCCGKELRVENDIKKEGVASFDIRWGYFSEKDGERHSFQICENCYDKWIEQFKIPVEVHEERELI